MSFDLALYVPSAVDVPTDVLVEIVHKHGGFVTAEDTMSFFLDEEAGLVDAQFSIDDGADPEIADAYPSYQFEDGSTLDFSGLTALVTYDESQRSALQLFAAIEELQTSLDYWVFDPQRDGPPGKFTADELMDRYNASAANVRAMLTELPDHPD